MCPPRPLRRLSTYPQAKREAERIAAEKEAARVAAEKAAKAASLAAAARDAYTGGTIRAGDSVWEYAAGDAHSVTCTAGPSGPVKLLWSPNPGQGTLCLFGDHDRTGTSCVRVLVCAMRRWHRPL